MMGEHDVVVVVVVVACRWVVRGWLLLAFGFGWLLLCFFVGMCEIEIRFN